MQKKRGTVPQDLTLKAFSTWRFGSKSECSQLVEPRTGGRLKVPRGGSSGTFVNWVLAMGWWTQSEREACEGAGKRGVGGCVIRGSF